MTNAEDVAQSGRQKCAARIVDKAKNIVGQGKKPATDHYIQALVIELTDLAGRYELLETRMAEMTKNTQQIIEAMGKVTAFMNDLPNVIAKNAHPAPSETQP